jgi:hypothetical protein
VGRAHPGRGGDGHLRRAGPLRQGAPQGLSGVPAWYRRAQTLAEWRGWERVAAQLGTAGRADHRAGVVPAASKSAWGSAAGSVKLPTASTSGPKGPTAGATGGSSRPRARATRSS